MLAPTVKLWPASDAVADAAVGLLDLGPSDTLVDYGCGNGVALFAAIRAGAGRAVGYELHGPRAAETAAAAAAAGLSDRIAVHAMNALDAPPGEATAVYLYLIGRGLSMMLPLLRAAAASAPGRTLRVATVLYRIPGVPHARAIKVFTSAVAMTPVYLYAITPESGLGGAVAAGSGEGEGADGVEAAAAAAV
jgi:hypothetical protein